MQHSDTRESVREIILDVTKAWNSEILQVFQGWKYPKKDCLPMKKIRKTQNIDQILNQWRRFLDCGNSRTLENGLDLEIQSD